MRLDQYALPPYVGCTMIATTASPKSHVRTHNAGAAPTVGRFAAAGFTGVGPGAVADGRGVVVVELITTTLSPMCMSWWPGPFAPSWSCHAASAACSLGEIGLYGTSLQGLTHGTA